MEEAPQSPPFTSPRPLLRGQLNVDQSCRRTSDLTQVFLQWHQVQVWLLDPSSHSTSLLPCFCEGQKSTN